MTEPNIEQDGSSTIDAPVPLGPVAASERIEVIDTLRGMALAGILAANMRGFFGTSESYFNWRQFYTWRPDVIVQTILDILVSGKFITIFAFLFGIGFAIQLERAEKWSPRPAAFYARRMLFLALFGLLHLFLVWWGDILLAYAITGIILLWFRHSRGDTQLWWAFWLTTGPVLAFAAHLAMADLGYAHGAMNPQHADLAANARQVAVFQHGTWLEMLRLRSADAIGYVGGGLFGVIAVIALPRFLAGMWVYRTGILTRLQESTRLLKGIFWWCLPIGLVMNTAMVILPALLPAARRDQPNFTEVFANFCDFYGIPVLSLAYVSGVALWLTLWPQWRARLRPFNAVGRMALTNYLMQSIVCTTFFNSYGTGLFGRVGPLWGLAPTVILYSLQVVFSTWWLRHYRFGPMEWVWRSLAYGRRQPLRIPLAAQQLAPVEGA